MTDNERLEILGDAFRLLRLTRSLVGDAMHGAPPEQQQMELAWSRHCQTLQEELHALRQMGIPPTPPCAPDAHVWSVFHAAKSQGSIPEPAGRFCVVCQTKEYGEVWRQVS